MKNYMGSLFSRRGMGDNRSLFFLCLLLFAVSSFFSFWVFFPAEVLQQRLVQELSRETGVRMRAEHAAMLVPLGLRMDLTLYPDRPGIAPLPIRDLHLTPVWTSLVSGNQAVNLKGSLARGDIAARLWRNGSIHLDVQDLVLSMLQDDALDYRLGGLLTVQLQGEELLEDVRRGQGHFAIEIRDTLLYGLEQIGLSPEGPLGLLQFNGRFSESRVSIEQLVATGGMLELSGGGTMLIGVTPEQTRLNLNVRFHPTRQTPESVRDLLMLTGVRPGPDGSYTMQIGGSLARPLLR